MDAIEKGFKTLQIRRRIGIISSIIITGVLAVALIKGCQNNNLRVAADLKIDSLISKGKQDSIKRYLDSIDFVNRMQYAEGKLELNYNSVLSLTDSLRTANDRIIKLTARYKPIIPSVDTSITTVPNEYINDCADCFNELEHDKGLVQHYQARVDSLKATLQIKSKIQEQRIKKLNEEKGKILSEFNECVNISKAQQKRYEPRRQLKMLFSPASIGQIFPNSIGFGGLYEDKKERDFGAEYFLTPHGPMYMLHCALPLSLTRKK